ncbi:MAG: hypothetical protein AAF004_00945 [Pseudomonadota bacterium]
MVVLIRSLRVRATLLPLAMLLIVANAFADDRGQLRERMMAAYNDYQALFDSGITRLP